MENAQESSLKQFFFYYLLSLSCCLNDFNFKTTRVEIKLELTSGWPLKNRILHYLDFPFLNSITNPSVQPQSYGYIYKGSFKGLLFLTCFNKDTCAVTPRNTRQAKMNVFFSSVNNICPFSLRTVVRLIRSIMAFMVASWPSRSIAELSGFHQ